MKQCNKILKRHPYDLAVAVKHTSFSRDACYQYFYKLCKGLFTLHHVFWGEGKVNGLLVIKRNIQKTFFFFLIIHPLHTVNISSGYFMRLYSKYNALYFALHHNGYTTGNFQ